MCQVRSKDGQDASSKASAAAADGSDYTCDDTPELNSGDIIQNAEEDPERSCDVCVG